MRRAGWVLCVSLCLGVWSGCGEEEAQSPTSDANNGGSGNNGGVNNGGSGNNAGVNNGGSGNNATQETALTYHRDIAPILAERCNNCHAPGGIGPFTLDSYEKVAMLKDAVKASVMERSMPPWQASKDCAEYFGDPSLSDEEVQKIAQWVEAGAPEGDPSQAPAEQTQEREQGLTRVDKTLTLPEPYTPSLQPDDYRCFMMDWPETETKFVTGFSVKPDNLTITHHVIAFLIKPELVDQYKALDDGEEGPGWTCYGGPGGDDDIETRWVGAWAPGGRDSDFPEGTGIRIEPGSKIVVQMHYNTLNGVGDDQTSLDFKVDDAVEREALIMPFANPAWLRGAMGIPADEAAAKHKFSTDVADWIPYLSDSRVSGGTYRIYSASLHMHNLGTSAKTWIEREDGQEECLLDIKEWDFHWQRFYPFEQYKLYERGDKLHLSCTWDNSQANQVSGMVDTDGDGEGDTYQQLETADRNWGEGTTDEMCLGIYFLTAD